MASRTPENETKEDRSLRLATARMLTALDKIRLIGNLAGPTYSFTTAQVAAMETALLNGVNDSIGKLRKVDTSASVFNFAPVVADAPEAVAEAVAEVVAEVTAEVVGDPAPEAVVVPEAEVTVLRGRGRHAA